MLRTCNKCGKEKPLDAFYKHPFAPLGRAARCKECTKAAVRENRRERIEYYRAYDRQRAKQPDRVNARAEYAKTHKTPRTEGNPIKRAARVKLGNALRDGKIAKPPVCDVCSQPHTLHGHHDDYTKPLDVIWCCTACHALIHAYWRAQERSAA